MKEWSDAEFLGYVDEHSRTDLALFSREHVNRLLRLAGREEITDLPSFVGMHRCDISDIIETARGRLET